jgi:hypothetical protein
MARPTIDQIRSIGNVAQLVRWNVIFAQFPTGLAAAPQSEALNLRCESSTIPKLSGASKTEIKIRGHKVNQPGIHTYSDSIVLTFLETVDNVVHQFLKNWRELNWQTKTGIQVPKADAEAMILLQRLDTEDNPIWEYKLVGCLLSDYEPGGTLGNAESEHLKPAMTISYDYFEDQAL